MLIMYSKKRRKEKEEDLFVLSEGGDVYPMPNNQLLEVGRNFLLDLVCIFISSPKHRVL